MNILAYFRSPFPSRQGFSAYRSPGAAAHIPFFLALSLTGLLLCGPGFSLLVWMVAGLYLGRDLAILCHYAPLLLLAIWAALLGVLAATKPLAAFGRRYSVAGAALTVLLLALQVWVAWRAAKDSA